MHRQRAGEVASEAPRERQSTMSPHQKAVAARQSEGMGLDNTETHPALLQLARILGRSAARAEMRRTRRGAVPIMRSIDALLLATVVAAAVLMWGLVVVLL